MAPSKAACGEDHDLAVWYTPNEVRGATEGRTLRDDVTDDDLRDAAGDALDGPAIWDLFHETLAAIAATANAAASARAAKAAGSTGAGA